MSTPLQNTNTAESTTCSRKRPPRLWTVADYQGLTQSLVPRLGVKPLLCANFKALDIDPGAKIQGLLAAMNEISGEEDTDVWLRGLLGTLLLIYGYIRKIKRNRMYRWVLKKFILITLLMLAIEKAADSLIRVVEWLILREEALRELQKLLTCQEDDDGPADDKQTDSDFPPP